MLPSQKAGCWFTRTDSGLPVTSLFTLIKPLPDFSSFKHYHASTPMFICRKIVSWEATEQVPLVEDSYVGASQELRLVLEDDLTDFGDRSRTDGADWRRHRIAYKCANSKGASNCSGHMSSAAKNQFVSLEAPTFDCIERSYCLRHCQRKLDFWMEITLLGNKPGELNRTQKQFHL